MIQLRLHSIILRQSRLNLMANFAHKGWLGLSEVKIIGFQGTYDEYLASQAEAARYKLMQDRLKYSLKKTGLYAGFFY